MIPALRLNIPGRYAGRMAYTYTEIFIWEPVIRREDVIKPAEIASSTWHATRQEQEADTASSRPGETKDDLRDHLKMMAAEGWNIDQYVVTAREDGFRHHMLWHKEGPEA